jgi:hypothetical protein
VELADGSKFWFLNGKVHRKDGPAIEWANGNKDWYLNGELYREEKAVVQWSNDSKRWWFPDYIELVYTEIELEALPEVFEDTQTLSFQEGGTVYEQDGWLHLEGVFRGQELIAPCIKTPVPLILKKPNTQEEQTLTIDNSGIYDQSGYELALDSELG